MAKELNKDSVYKAAKPKAKDYRIQDGEGLYMLVKTNGVKRWCFVYRFRGKQNRRGFGVYPETTLENARRQAEEVRKQIKEGIDPAQYRKQQKAEQKRLEKTEQHIKAGKTLPGSFADVCNTWLQSIAHLNSPTTLKNKRSRLERFAFTAIGHEPIQSIRSSDIYDILKPLIQTQKLDTAHRLRAEISAVFDYAIVHNLVESNPAQPVLKQIPAHKATHRAAITDPQQIAQLLRDIYSYQGTFVVQCALRMSALLFQRPGEIRTMLWADIDLAAKEWRPYISKTDFEHIVPLSTQAIEIIESIQPLTGLGKYVFPSIRANGRPMSDNTIGTALKALGYDSNTQTAHGFRSVASTLLNEQGWSPDAIERQLSHAPRDKIRAAYNRAQYLDERRKMMQAWANYLDELRHGAKILPFKQVG